MLKRPVFIFSAARSGSTLLRAILGSHSKLYAPPELPLRHMQVHAETKWIQTSLKALQLNREELEHLLWDRVLAETLSRSGKPVAVIKTPSNVLYWSRIAEIWPDARFIFLLRHPAAAVASLHRSWDAKWQVPGTDSLEKVTASALRYMRKLEDARDGLTGYTIRYEDLTADPDTNVRQLCRFLGLAFEPAMLEYGQFADFRIAPGLGDASKNIRSGRIQPAKPPPAGEIPPDLAKMCAIWGYRQPDGQAYDTSETPDWDTTEQPVDETLYEPEDLDYGPSDAQREEMNGQREEVPSEQH